MRAGTNRWRGTLRSAASVEASCTPRASICSATIRSRAGEVVSPAAGAGVQDTAVAASRRDEAHGCRL